MDLPLLAAAGLAVGVIVGLTGVGAGSVMTPLLISGFGIPTPVAVGTDLACAAVTKTAGTVAHRASRNVVPRVVALLAAGSVPAAIITLACIAISGYSSAELARVMRAGIAVALVTSIGALLLRGSLLRRLERTRNERGSRPLRGLVTVLVGALMGMAVALTSLGAGAIGAACMAMLYPELDPS
jgi:uncharacterized protein